jgi:two-component system, OmpR family, KDP operon response regulator KdpE
MNKAEILIIDDEPQIRKLLQINLESNNYKVIEATNGKEGIALTASFSPDLILLDIGLPDKSGHEVLIKLREWFYKPIIVLSVQNDEQDIISALDNGATDYLTKPFRTGELLARIRSALGKNNNNDTESILKSENIEINLITRNTILNGKILKLTSTEYNLLVLFAKNQGRVLTHQYILKQIWGIGSQYENQYLRVFVRNLRKKIESNPENPKHIFTESGVGYRFI